MTTWHIGAIGLGLALGAGCSYINEQPAAPGGLRPPAAADDAATPDNAAPAYRAGAVRYQVTDVARSVDFYTKHLGFTAAGRSGPAFAMIVNGPLTLWLSGPESSGSRPMPDGTPQQPGGWNRIALEVSDLPARVEAMRRAGLRFRNDIETGPGGRQIQLEDPDGNPVELFEPAARVPADSSAAGRGPERRVQ